MCVKKYCMTGIALSVITFAVGSLPALAAESVVADDVNRSTLSTSANGNEYRKNYLRRAPSAHAAQRKAETVTPDMMGPEPAPEDKTFERNIPGANQPKDVGYAVSPLLFVQPTPGATPGAGEGAALSGDKKINHIPADQPEP